MQPRSRSSRTSSRRHSPAAHCRRATSAWIIPFLLIGSLGLGTSGCQEIDSSSPLQLAPVSGRIELDGEPVSGAKVVLLPTRLFSSGKRVIPVATGLTDSSGRFELRSDGASGVVAGDYWVLLSKLDEDHSSSADTQVSELPRDALADPEELPRQLAELASDSQFESSDEADWFPAFYNSETRLRLTVPPEGTQEANFELSILDLPLLPKER